MRGFRQKVCSRWLTLVLNTSYVECTGFVMTWYHQHASWLTHSLLRWHISSGANTVVSVWFMRHNSLEHSPVLEVRSDSSQVVNICKILTTPVKCKTAVHNLPHPPSRLATGSDQDSLRLPSASTSNRHSADRPTNSSLTFTLPTGRGRTLARRRPWMFTGEIVFNIGRLRGKRRCSSLIY